MHDFFNYSGMGIQNKKMNADLAKPTNPGGIRGGKNNVSDFELM